MRILEVIESKRWINSRTGQTASIYGAVPYTSAADQLDWAVEAVGFTWRCQDGTVGLGRRPVSTYAEAILIMNLINGVI